MKPVNPASEEDNLRPSQTQSASAPESTDSESDFETVDSETSHSEINKKAEEQVVDLSAKTASERLASQVAGPLENLQRRYTEQLSQDIGRLESEKAQLELDIASLQANYERLQKDVKSLREFEARTVSPSLGDSSQERPRSRKELQSSVSGPRLPGEPVSIVEETVDVPKPSPKPSMLKGLPRDLSYTDADTDTTDIDSTKVQTPEAQITQSRAAKAHQAAEAKILEFKNVGAKAAEASTVEASTAEAQTAEAQTQKTESVKAAPLLPGETAVPSATPKASKTSAPPTEPDSADQPVRPIELPIPATSEQRRQTSIQTKPPSNLVKLNLRKGVILSAIATILMAWHYSLIGTLGAGGTWFGFPVGELGAGFVPAVALLWLRMLVTIPALGALAPQLYKDTWDDIQDWVYTRDRLVTLLICSGAALFISQVLIYQCVGLLGPVLGITLLFLYPLTASPLGALLAQERKMTPLGCLAIVAIAMGGVLALRPFLASTANLGTSIWFGLFASVAFSLYIVLTNISYRQQCHPIPVGVVQFSTVAVLSSLVLLVKPLRLANISWVGFVVWGLLLGVVMLLVYLFTYSSLRMIGSRTGIVVAATPLVIALVAIGFAPLAPLEIIQWTGVGLVAIGGIALGKEKLGGKP